MLDEKSGQAYNKVKYERRSEWGESMKYGQISREQLLQAAKVLVAQEGAQALNIRRLAASCGVSVGSIYNYFPAKSDLVAALIGDFWREAVHGVPWPLTATKFEDCVEILYERLYDYFQTFEQEWLSQLMAMNQQERKRGKQVEAQQFAHMRQRLLAVLLQDETISSAVWDETLTPEALVNLDFEQLLTSLRQNQPDVGVLLAVLRRLLHEN